MLEGGVGNAWQSPNFEREQSFIAILKLGK